MDYNGYFIVIEGIDGVGTTTHAKLLAEFLIKKGIPVHLTSEPSMGPVGLLLRLFLSGRLSLPGRTGPRAPSWKEMALLFSADRIDHIDSEILPNITDGVTVISDRYYHSTLVYQTVTSSTYSDKIDRDIFEWIKTINKWAIVPDLTIILDLSYQEAKKRRHLRPIGIEIFDDDELQARFAEAYKKLPELLPQEKIVIVNGEGDIEEVHKRCCNIIEKELLSRNKRR